MSKRWPIDASRYGKDAVEEVGFDRISGPTAGECNRLPECHPYGLHINRQPERQSRAPANLDMYENVSWVRKQQAP